MDTENLQEYRFCRVPFGIIASPFLLGATIDHHLQSYGEIADKLTKDIYVDNVITGADSVNELIDICTEGKTLFSPASMNLHDWMSNSEEVMKHIQNTDRAKEEDLKVLGHIWNTEDDTLSLKHTKIEDSTATVTKREVLKQIVSMYDPGTERKIFMKSLWGKGTEWDEELQNADKGYWKEIYEDFDDIHLVNFPRYVGLEQPTTFCVFAMPQRLHMLQHCIYTRQMGTCLRLISCSLKRVFRLHMNLVYLD